MSAGKRLLGPLRADWAPPALAPPAGCCCDAARRRGRCCTASWPAEVEGAAVAAEAVPPAVLVGCAADASCQPSCASMSCRSWVRSAGRQHSGPSRRHGGRAWGAAGWRGSARGQPRVLRQPLPTGAQRSTGRGEGAIVSLNAPLKARRDSGSLSIHFPAPGHLRGGSAGGAEGRGHRSHMYIPHWPLLWPAHPQPRGPPLPRRTPHSQAWRCTRATCSRPISPASAHKCAGPRPPPPRRSRAGADGAGVLALAQLERRPLAQLHHVGALLALGAVPAREPGGVGGWEDGRMGGCGGRESSKVVPAPACSGLLSRREAARPQAGKRVRTLSQSTPAALPLGHLQGGVFLRHWQRRRCRRPPPASSLLDSPSRTARHA